MVKLKERNRVTVKMSREHHRILKSRRDQTGTKFEALLDEALELGMRMKRWIPEVERETAAA